MKTLVDFKPNLLLPPGGGVGTALGRPRGTEGGREGLPAPFGDECIGAGGREPSGVDRQG